LPGRVKCGGKEGEIVVAHGCRKRKKLICGTEGEIVVAHGPCLPPLTQLHTGNTHSTDVMIDQECILL